MGKKRASFRRQTATRQPNPPKEDRYEASVKDIITGKRITFQGTHAEVMAWIESLPDRKTEMAERLGHATDEFPVTKERAAAMTGYLKLTKDIEE